MEGLDMMDWMLAEAKKAPMKISHDFDTRFRVWVEQIIPSRIDAIRQCKGDVDYAIRMVKLTGEDAHRLRRRAFNEYVRDDYPIHTYSLRVEAILNSLYAANDVYLDEAKQ